MATRSNSRRNSAYGGWPRFFTDAIQNRAVLLLLALIVLAIILLATIFTKSCPDFKISQGELACKAFPTALAPTADTAGVALEAPPAPTAVSLVIQSPTSIAPSSTARPALPVDPTLTPTAPSAQCSPLDANLPRNAQLIKCTWDFWNDGRYVETVAEAQECIAEFEGQALREQQALSAAGQPMPVIGKPESEVEKNEILARGVLNDVAACHFALGQALQRLDQSDAAKAAYTETLQFPHARVWDQAGFFWSPAQTAADRLALWP